MASKNKELIDEAKNFAKQLDSAADKALESAVRIVNMTFDMDPYENKQLSRLLAVQVEAAKLILSMKLKTGDIGDGGNEVLSKLFDSFKVEYKATATIVSNRPEVLPSRIVDGEHVRLQEHHQ